MRSTFTRLLALAAPTLLTLNLVGCAVGSGNKSGQCNCDKPTTQCTASDHSKCGHAK